MAYGSDIPKNYGAAAEYVAKILNGEKPGNLPIQQPVFYDLVINLKVLLAPAAGSSFALPMIRVIEIVIGTVVALLISLVR